MDDLFIRIFVIITFWSLVGALTNYFKKRGSRLGQEKPIYKWIALGIFIIVVASFMIHALISNWLYYRGK